MKALEEGKERTPHIGYGFDSPEPLRKFLTSKRFALLQAIWTHQPRSVYELAKTVHRPRMAVVADLKELGRLRMVVFKRGRYRGRRVSKPIVPFDRIHIEIDLRQGHVTEQDK